MKRSAFQKRMLRKALYAARCREWLRPQTFAQCAALAQLHSDGLLYRRGEVAEMSLS